MAEIVVHVQKQLEAHSYAGFCCLQEDDGVPLNRREQRRRDRAEQREAEAAAREARQNKINAYEERRKKKDEEREAKEKAQVSLVIQLGSAAL